MTKSFKSAWILAMLALAIVVQAAATASTLMKWTERAALDELVTKDRTEVYRIRGALDTLKALGSGISEGDRKAELEELYGRMSIWLGDTINSEDNLQFALHFFDSTQDLPLADKVYAVFLVAKLMMVVAVLLCVIAIGALTTIYIMPLAQKLPTEVKIAGLYLLTAGITVGAYYLPAIVQNFGGLFGALCLGGAYVYHLSTCPPRETVPKSIFLPPLAVWSCLAIIFHTQLIGFIAVLTFAAFLGFSVRPGEIFEGMGFQDKHNASMAVLPSGLLLVVFIARKLGAFEAIKTQMEPFDAGVFFVGTIVYFTSLLIVSWKDYHRETYLCYNVLLGISCIGAIFVGAFVPDLYVFRGLGATFLIFFLIEKFAEIPWGYNWPCALLCGGLILFGLGYFLKANWEKIY